MTSREICEQFSHLIDKLHTLTSIDRFTILELFKNSLSTFEPSGQLPTELLSASSSTTTPIPSPLDAVISNLYAALCGSDFQNDDHSSNSTVSSHKSSLDFRSEYMKKNCFKKSSRGDINDRNTSTSSPGGTNCKLPNSSQRASGTPLFCPLCREEFSTWLSLEQHLYSGHDNSGGQFAGPHLLVPVCWRCQGVFGNAALLLAHECFDWGRLHLPSQLTDPQSSRRRAFLCSTSADVGYPPKGVFLKRRCGLCFRSSVLYTSLRGFQQHKATTHPGGKSAPDSVVSRQRSHLKGLRLTDTDGELGDCTDSLAHPSSEVALRNMVRNVFYRFARSASCRTDARRQTETPSSSTHPPSPPMGTLPANQSDAPEGGGADSAELDSAAPATTLHLADQQPTGSKSKTLSSRPDRQAARQRPTTSARSSSLVWRQKRRSSASRLPRRLAGGRRLVAAGQTTVRQKRTARQVSSPTALTVHEEEEEEDDDSDDYHYYDYPRHNGFRRSHRLACQRCPAVFRLTSRLRAHYLFQHGHIPTNLPGAKSPEHHRSGNRHHHHQQHRSGSSKGTVPMRDFDSGNQGGRPEASTSSAPAEDSEAVAVSGDTDAMERSSGFACTLCSKVYTSAGNLRRHVTTAHFEEFRYFCGYCEFRTSERFAYDEHLARHFRVKQFVCEFCDARFTVKRELKDHLAFKHISERKHHCTTCGLTFKTAGTLWRHRTIHGERRLHTCTLCPAVFTRQSNLKRHLGRAHKQQTMPPPTGASQTLITIDLRPGRFAGGSEVRVVGEAAHHHGQQQQQQSGTGFVDLQTGGDGDGDVEEYCLPDASDRASPAFTEASDEQDRCDAGQDCDAEEVPSHVVSQILLSPTPEEFSQQLSGGSEEDAFNKSAACGKQYSVDEHFLQDDSLMDDSVHHHTIVPVDLTAAIPVVDDSSPQAIAAGGVNAVFLLNLTDLDSVPSLFESAVALPSAMAGPSGLVFADANSAGTPSTTHSLFEQVGERGFPDGSQFTSAAAAFVSLFPLQLNQPVSPGSANANADGDGDNAVINPATGWPAPVSGQHQEGLPDGSASLCPRTLAVLHEQNLCYLFTGSGGGVGIGLDGATAPSDVYSLTEVVHLQDSGMHASPAAQVQSAGAQGHRADEAEALNSPGDDQLVADGVDCAGEHSDDSSTSDKPLFRTLGDQTTSDDQHGPSAAGLWRPIKTSSSPEPQPDCQFQSISSSSFAFWQSGEQDEEDRQQDFVPDDPHHQDCCLSNFSVGYLIGQRSEDAAGSRSDEMMAFDDVG